MSFEWLPQLYRNFPKLFIQIEKTYQEMIKDQGRDTHTPNDKKEREGEIKPKQKNKTEKNLLS